MKRLCFRGGEVPPVHRSLFLLSIFLLSTLCSLLIKHSLIFLMRYWCEWVQWNLWSSKLHCVVFLSCQQVTRNWRIPFGWYCIQLAQYATGTVLIGSQITLHEKVSSNIGILKKKSFIEWIINNAKQYNPEGNKVEFSLDVRFVKIDI